MTLEAAGGSARAVQKHVRGLDVTVVAGPSAARCSVHSYEYTPRGIDTLLSRELLDFSI